MKNTVKILVIGVFLTALTAGSGVYSLSFKEISSDLDNTFEVKNAVLQKEAAYNSVNLARSPGDIQISAVPGVKTVSGEIEYYGSAALKIPVGLSQLEKEKLSFSEDSYSLAYEKIESARNSAFITLHRLYQDAYLIQEEESVIRLELEAAESMADILSQQYKNGNVPLSALSSAQEDLQDKREELSQELLKQRVSLYELAFTAGMAVKEELLERFVLEMEELPAPPALTLNAMEKNPDIQAQKQKVQQISRTIDRLRGIDLGLSIKPFYSSAEHSVSLEYSVTDPLVSISYSFSPSISGQTSGSWSAGISASLSFNSGKNDSLNIEVLQIQQNQENARLEYLTNLLSLQIRSSYQEYLKAKDTLEQSRRDLARTMDNKKIVEAKAALGQAAEYEIKEAYAQVKRAEWKVESSRINLEKAYLKTAETAALGKLYE